MAEREAKPVDLGDDPSGGKEGQRATGGQKPPRARGGRPTKFDALEDRLNEVFAALAMAQSSLTLLTADERHDVAAAATMETSPALVHSWVKLARENPRVEKILRRMTEGSAWGEVTIASMTFLLAQAQAYDLVQWSPFPPPSPEVQAEQASRNGEPAPPVPPAPPVTGRSAADARSGVNAEQDPAHNIAEAQRRQVEERRRRRGS